MNNNESLAFLLSYIFFMVSLLAIRVGFRLEAERQQALKEIFAEIRRRKIVYKIEGNKMILIYDWREPWKYPDYKEDGDDL